MRERFLLVLSVIFGLLIVVLSSALFTLNERQLAIVLQLGEIRSVVTNPGLHFKVPFVQSVYYFDSRIRTLNSREPERFITSEKKNLLVDLFIKWKVKDPELFYIAVSGRSYLAEQRLSQTVNAGLREEFGRRTVHEVIADTRRDIMNAVREKANHDTQKIGVEVIDVRLTKVDLPPEVSSSVYSRMAAERKRVANELRSEGAAEAERIRANADRQREVILALAYKKSQEIKGHADAAAAAIYAQAYASREDFYKFYKSMESYQNAFSDPNDLLVLDPASSKFFQYFKQPQ